MQQMDNKSIQKKLKQLFPDADKRGRVKSTLLGLSDRELDLIFSDDDVAVKVALEHRLAAASATGGVTGTHQGGAPVGGAHGDASSILSAADMAQIAQHAARLVAVEGKRQKLSVTTSIEVGAQLLAAPAPHQPILTLSNTRVPPCVNEDFKLQWEAITDEAGVQKLLTQLFLEQRKKPRGGKQTRFALDTHEKNYYHVPTAKIDLALSASAQPFWTTLESCTEVKFKLIETNHEDAIGQVYTRAGHIFDAQPQREFVVQCIAGKDAVELWKFSKTGGSARSGCRALEWQEGNPGYETLMAYLKAEPLQLGYMPLAPLNRFQGRLPTEEVVWFEELTPMSNIPSRRLVYKGSFRTLTGTRDVVVKFGSTEQIDHEVSLLQRSSVQGTGVPKVLCRDKLPKTAWPNDNHLTDFYVMEPFGMHVSGDQPPSFQLSVLLDVCNVLQRLAAQQLLHRDISADNIVAAEIDGRWTGFLLDYHVCASVQDALARRVLTGKPMYWSLKLHAAQRAQQRALRLNQLPVEPDGQGVYNYPYTEQTDVESLFYTCLEWASNGGACLWRHAIDEADIHWRKFSTMFSSAEWREALSRCNEQLQPLLEQLHDEIFQGSEAQYLQHTVSFQRVGEIVNSVLQGLPQQAVGPDDLPGLPLSQLEDEGELQEADDTMETS